jgi:hypothetical protein
VNSAVVHCTLQGFIARLVVRADKGRRAVWNYRVHDVYNATHETYYELPAGVPYFPWFATYRST